MCDKKYTVKIILKHYQMPKIIYINTIQKEHTMKKKILTTILLINFSLMSIVAPLPTKAATLTQTTTPWTDNTSMELMAPSANSSEIYWGEYIISTDGCIEEYLGHSSEVIIPKVIENVSISSTEVRDIPITSIGAFAFSSCDELTSITIPDSITTIEFDAFLDCSGLTSVNIPASVSSLSSTAFRDCANLTDVNVSGNNAHYKSIDGVVYSKSGDTLVICPSGKTEVNIENVTTIGHSAFTYCDKLTDIILPGSVTSIEAEAFEYCNNLKSISLPNSLTTIGYEAFSGCDGLTEITIPNSVTTIGDNAFSYCNNLAKVTLSDSLISIGHSAFHDCINLSDITIPDSVTTLDGTFNGCDSLTDLSFFDSVTTIESYAFGYCEGLKKITIPDCVTHIGNSTFRYCINLTDVIIPDTVTTIDDFAFANCDNLTSVTIPESVTFIDVNVFMNSPENLTIYGYAGSTAETYANQQEINFQAIEKPVVTLIPVTPSVPTATNTPVPTATNTPVPTATNTPVPTATNTPVPTATNTPVPTATNTPVPTATNTPVPTATSTPTPTQTVKNNQKITAENITKTYGDKAFSIKAKTSGDGNLSYTSGNKKIVTISSKGKISIKGCGKTTITIKASETKEYKSAEKKITITVKPKKQQLSSAKSKQPKTITVSWKKDKNATGYILQYSTDKHFKKNVKTVTISNNKTTSKKIEKLKPRKKYYVRVCSYKKSSNGKVCGDYSKVKTITVKK